MSPPAEPHISSSGQIPLTARALDQLDAQVAAAEVKSSHKPNKTFTASSSNMHDTSRNDPDLHNRSNKMVEVDKTRAVLESEISKDSHQDSSTTQTNNTTSSHNRPQDPSVPVPLMIDYIVDGTIYRSPDTLETLITIKPTPTKGLAVFALCDLPPHTLLLSERPLVALNDNGARSDPLDGLVNGLAPPLKRAYRSLHGFSSSSSNISTNNKKRAPRESLNRRVLYSNGFAIQCTTTAVFEIASRINHSCVPNARFRWDEEAGRMDYYTVEKVLKGEEVCIDYGHTKGRLLKYYGFECACGGCTERGSVTASDSGDSKSEEEEGFGEDDDDVDSMDEGVDEKQEVRLVQTDGLWRPVKVAQIVDSVKEEIEPVLSN